MTIKNYTYKDAVKANKDIKRYVEDRYIYEEDLKEWDDPHSFASSDEDGTNFWIKDVCDRALSPFLRGHLCTEEQGEDFESYIERVHFEPSVATTPEDRAILEGMDESETIYAVHTVNTEGEPTGVYYFVDAGTLGYDSPEEALRNSANAAYDWAMAGDHIRRYTHHGQPGEFDYYAGFETMDEAHDFASKFGLSVDLYEQGEGIYRQRPENNNEPRLDMERGIDLCLSDMDGASYLERGMTREEFDEKVIGILIDSAETKETVENVREYGDEAWKVYTAMSDGQVMLADPYWGRYEVFDGRFVLYLDWCNDIFEVIAH